MLAATVFVIIVFANKCWGSSSFVVVPGYLLLPSSLPLSMLP